MAYDISLYANYPSRTNHNLQLYVRRAEQSGNASRYAWQLIARRNSGAVSWHYDGLPWYVHIGGQEWGGSTGLPFSSSTNQVVIAGGETGWIGHDGNGYLTIWVWARHGGGQFGTASIGNTRFDTDRIAQVPRAPHSLSVSGIFYNTAGVYYRRNDDMGSPIRQDEAQWARSDDGFVFWNDGGPNGYSSPNAGATPGAPALVEFRNYQVRVRSRNDVGWGPYSDWIRFRTLGTPTRPVVTSLQPGQMRVEFFYPGSNYIRDPIGYTIEWATNPEMTQNRQSVDVGPNTGAAYSRNDLPPGARLWVRYHARYSDAFSPWSPTTEAVLLSGIYYSHQGGEWEGAGTFASNGSRLDTAQVLYSNGTSWLDAK